MEYENIDSQLVKNRQTSTIQKYQTRFHKLYYLACDWTDQQLLGTFIQGPKPEIKGEVKARQPHTGAAAISFAEIQEERLNQDAQRMRTTPRPMAYKPSIPSYPSLPKKLTREELRDRSSKGLCWFYDELWSHDHHCKKGRLLLIEPLEDVEEEVQEHEEVVTEEEEQPVDITMHALAGYANPQTMKVGGFLRQEPITILIDTGSNNNFMNNKVVVQITLPIKDCSKFDVKVADGRLLKCDRRCPWVKLLL
ncbi:hypothetical protein BHE74_00057019 [Ensete ventricosum]|nr:hypothetical protein BHE74_00057019 [Ensete ventricosum]